jgi:hypothetical protein
MLEVTTRGEVTPQGVLKVEVPCAMPPGPVDVTLTVHERSEPARPDWDKLYGLGKEIWAGIDADEYLRDLRQDRELAP